MKKIAAVICNYNKSGYVTDCIQSVTESVFKDLDIYVVDNASTDDSVARIKELYGSKVHLFENKENLGGSGGFNTGIRYAVEKGYEYVWCLDNDVLVDENAIGALYGFMEKNPEVGMTGSKVYHMEAPDYVQQFGITIDWNEYCCEAKYYNRAEDGTMPEVVYSDAVAACSVLVRTSLIQEIGPLPEENFLYWDDTEWGYRCNLAGYKVASYGKSKVLHSMGAKKESESTFPMYYAWRNWIRFFMKYLPAAGREDMCEAFLEGIFDIVYNDMYLEETSRAKTVMYAYDDAIHGVTGKAGGGKIFPVIHSTGKLEKLLINKTKVKIYEGGCREIAEEFAERVKEAAEKSDIKVIMEIVSGFGTETMCTGADGERTEISFTMTKDIFQTKDLELKTIYVDAENRIMSSREDVFMVIHREYSRKLFVFSQKTIFLKAAESFF